MKKNQKGFADGISVVLFLMIVGMAVIFYLTMKANSEAKERRTMMESMGYTLIVSYSSSNKYLPDASPCVDEEFKYVTSGYRVVSSLADARGVMCKIKEDTVRNKVN